MAIDYWDTFKWAKNDLYDSKRLSLLFNMIGFEGFYQEFLHTNLFKLDDYNKIIEAESLREFRYVEKIVATKKITSIREYKVSIVLCSQYISQVGQELNKDKTIDYSIIINPVNGAVCFRTSKDIDLVPYAKIFNGGGHSKACAGGYELFDSIVDQIKEKLK
jgi:oligoribonuclease NrnB/cAMP/cGMP phosphodiesterase (DHH superfamily)